MKAVDLKAKEINSGIGIGVKELNISAQIRNLEIGELEILLSTVGEIDTTILLPLLN